MGQRANLIVVDSADPTQYQLFYCHWCANRLDVDLFWGPNYALPYVMTQRPMNATDWLDELWAEGGAVLDIYRKVLLLYGGEDILNDIPLRRLYVSLLQFSWYGWKVRWAYNGIFDLADYVGYPRQRVISSAQHAKTTENTHRPIWPSPKILRRNSIQSNSVGSIIFEGGLLRLFPMPKEVVGALLRSGPGMVNVAPVAYGLERVDMSEWVSSETFTQTGFHIDVTNQQIGFWHTQGQGLFDAMQVAWPGWDVIWWHDQFEKHQQLVGAALSFPTRADGVLLADLQDILLRQNISNPLDTLKQIQYDKEHEGHDVQVNPYALRYDPPALTQATRHEIFNDAIVRWTQVKDQNR